MGEITHLCTAFLGLCLHQDLAYACREGLPPHAGTGGAGTSSRPQTYTAEQLRGKTLAQLMEVLKLHSLPVRGKKEELVQRLLEAQDRAKRAAAPA